jgi:peptidoglycan/LPS O-acetylase OafA/YrhL
VKFLYKLTDISSIKRISFRQDINGLRAIAVLAVVFYHAELELFKGGWLGVDIFFVISGYLISNIIISELNEGTFTFKIFYLRRLRRILPALFSTLLLTIPFAYFFLTPKAMQEYIDSLIASVFFYANYHFMNLDFYVAESTKFMPLLHTWSLAIEEQYYLLFPLFAFIIYKYFKKYFAFFIGFIIVGSLYLNTLSQDVSQFYKLEFRIWELLLGVLVMILSSNFKIKHLEKFGLPIMIFPIFYFGDEWINHTEPKLLALIGISLIIFSNTDSSFLTKILSFKIVSIIGTSSYSIYLLHQPIFAFYKIILQNSTLIRIKYLDLNLNESINILEYSKRDFKNIIFDLLLFLLTILLGYLSYKYIEKPFIKNKHYLLLFFSFIFLSSFMLLNPSSTFENKGSDSHPNLNNETLFSDYDCWQRYSLNDGNFQELENCFINNNSTKNLIILGDSSSASISKNIIQKNLFKNYNIYFVSVGYDIFFENFKNFTNCNGCFLNWIQDNSSTIVVSVELHRFIELNGIYYTDEYSNKDVEVFKENINYLKKYSENLLLLESFPTIPSQITNPKDLLIRDELGVIKEIYIPYFSWVNNTQLTTDTYYEFENNFNINIVRTNDLFCNKEKNKCTIYKDYLLYLDQVHLSISGGQLITEKLSPLLED